MVKGHIHALSHKEEFEMNKKAVFAFLAVALLMMSTVYADGLSIQIKRTNPGIAKEKSAEIIFDVVNTDMTHKVEGFIFCRSPDDAVVSSSLGVGSGSGAQYISPKFEIETGPAQKAMTLTLDADVAGDKRTGCIIKYIPFKEEEVEEEVTTTTTDEEGNEVTETRMEASMERSFLKLNGDYIDSATDNDYREIRLDKSVPFSGPTAEEGAGIEGFVRDNPVWIVLILLALGVAYVMGKSA